MAFALQPAAQLRTSIVEHLVDRAARRLELTGDDVDLDVVNEIVAQIKRLHAEQVIGGTGMRAA